MSKMLIDRAAVEQALEALEGTHMDGESQVIAKAINALRAALAQEEQEPVGDSYADLFNALQRIETAAVFLPSFKITHEGGLEAVVQNIVDAIAALAQEEQEPVGNSKKFFDEVLYTGALPQSQQDQPDINWLRARPYIEQFIEGAGYDMTLTNERVRFEAREKVDVRQEAQEPVAWLKEWNSVGNARTGMRRVDLTPESETWLANMFPTITPLYTHPPRREWQGLTEQRDELLKALEDAAEAFEILANDGGVDTYWYARFTSDAVAKAKEKK
jgi:Flp pilus assembly protein TadG